MSDTNQNPRVRLTTNVGVIELELYADKAPGTVKNFLEYVDSGFYNGTIFHRVIENFMIQGGGMLPIPEDNPHLLKEKPTRPPITNEADNGLKNVMGTIAMARTRNPDSASAQFFINTRDNAFLDHRNKTIEGWGYAVFGKVIKGMDVVKKIGSKRTRTVAAYENVPLKNIIITKAVSVNTPP